MISAGSASGGGGAAGTVSGSAAVELGFEAGDVAGSSRLVLRRRLAAGSIRIRATPSTSASDRSSSGSHSDVSQTVNSVSDSTSSSCSAGGRVSRTRPLAASRFSTRRAFMSGSGRFGSKTTVTPIRSGPSNPSSGTAGCSASIETAGCWVGSAPGTGEEDVAAGSRGRWLGFDGLRGGCGTGEVVSSAAMTRGVSDARSAVPCPSARSSRW